jgi:hypothetical protein
MQKRKRLFENLAIIVDAAGAIVTAVEFARLFRQETGVKKELYCKNEGKLTTFVSISWSDLQDMRRKAVENNLPDRETLPDEKEIVFMSLNPFAPKPYVCSSCSNVRLE